MRKNRTQCGMANLMALEGEFDIFANKPALTLLQRMRDVCCDAG